MGAAAHHSPYMCLIAAMIVTLYVPLIPLSATD